MNQATININEISNYIIKDVLESCSFDSSYFQSTVGFKDVEKHFNITITEQLQESIMDAVYATGKVLEIFVDNSNLDSFMFDVNMYTDCVPTYIEDEDDY